MPSSHSDESDDPLSMLAAATEEPAAAVDRLPQIVGLFDSDDRRVRLGAAWLCCLLVTEADDDGTTEYVVRRLSDRLGAEEVSLELTTALDYLANRHPSAVEEILLELESADDDLPLPAVGSFTRSGYYGNDPEPEREGIGRSRVAGDATADDPRRAYTESEDDEGRERTRKPESDDQGSEEGDPAGGSMSDQREAVTDIAERSRFDALHVLASRRQTRYADVYDALVGGDGGEQAVALRLLDRPETNREAYRRRIATQLERWADVSDHGGVVTAFDWGIEPKPWLTTDVVESSLADRDRLSTERAVSNARSLARALSALHRGGVVHAGLDPKTVVYRDASLERSGSESPLLDNVGLMNAVRHHFSPALYLDPRFAAPEYFDDRYGGIDHATDVYGLGALLFRLCTGRPPFRGQFDDVRTGVLEADPPRPSDVVATVPSAVDNVVAKAMSKRKLTRYETVEHLSQDLARIEAGGE